MSTSKHIDKICIVILIIALILTALFLTIPSGAIASGKTMGYEDKLFDDSKVHTIDIAMDDWDSFIETCTDENYAECNVTVDGEKYNDVGLRAKGNTSLSSVKNYGNNRYSFKIEFDHYDNALSYYGLDKLCLNNIIQDNTYMKDYLCYKMMSYIGVSSPLCSYVYLTVNGEDWGLYLAVEGIEESFLQRNYGNSYGNLYKPDTSQMGGGPGNGKGFEENADEETAGGPPQQAEQGVPQGEPPQQTGQDVPSGEPTAKPEDTGKDTGKDDRKAGDSSNSDVSLIYTDDEYDSYANIFDNAKTDISDDDRDRLISSLKDLNNGENLANVVNIKDVIKYFVVHNFVLNFDSYTGGMIHNYYLYEDDGQMSMIPWDYNLAFGAFQSSANDATSLVNYPIDTPVSGNGISSRPMLSWIFDNDEYTDLYHQYFYQFIGDWFESGYFNETIDEVSEMIAPYVKKDPTKFCTYDEFEKGVETLREFCNLRAESVEGQLNGDIPSTNTEQQKDDSAFIDAGALSVNDMGSMDSVGKGNQDGNRNFSDSGEMPEAPGTHPPEDTTPPNSGKPPDES